MDRPHECYVWWEKDCDFDWDGRYRARFVFLEGAQKRNDFPHLSVDYSDHVTISSVASLKRYTSPPSPTYMFLAESVAESAVSVRLQVRPISVRSQPPFT